MNSSTGPIAVFGGTFDPIHNGHLAAADNLQQHITFSQIRFIPCKQPVLKSAAQATSLQRLAMLQLALAGHPSWQIDTRELDRDTPSYTVETLQSLQTDFPETPLCLILGMDAFNQLPQWHCWQQLLSLAHIIVIERPAHELDDACELAQLIQVHQTNDLTQLQQPYGKLIFLDLPPYDIASTNIRTAIATGEDVSEQVPTKVWAYIQENHLYL